MKQAFSGELQIPAACRDSLHLNGGWLVSCTGVGAPEAKTTNYHEPREIQRPFGKAPWLVALE